MNYLQPNSLFRKLNDEFSFDRDGYFYNSKCSVLRSVWLSSRVGLDRLLRVTTRYARQVDSESLLVFTDHLAGWRGVSKGKKHFPVEISIDELGRFVNRHVHFRDPKGYADNYYFTDEHLSWFAVFCHEGDWHLFSRHRSVLSKLSLR